MATQHPPSGGWAPVFKLAALTLLATLSSAQLAAAPAQVSATAKFNKRLAKVIVAGRTARTVPVGSVVYVYDPDTQALLYSARTKPNRSFNITMKDEVLPCAVRVEAGTGQVLAKVSGLPTTAAASCAAATTCSIAGETGTRKLKVGDTLSLSAGPVKRARGASGAPSYQWDLGDGTSMDGSAVSHTFDYPGLYNVRLVVGAGTDNQCVDDLSVAVAPVAANLPTTTVPEAEARPAAKSGMSGAYAVLPFNEKGEVGSGHMSIPYDQYPATQGLNAVVYLKDPKKPVAQDLPDVDVYYSAALNPNDPVGPDSINSTSQNWFSGEPGANYDLTNPNAHSSAAGAQTTTIVPNRNFDGDNDGIRKTGFYDRFNNRNNTGGSQATRQSRKAGTDLTRLDEGLRGWHDNFNGLRKMPGIAGPYEKNDPQKIEGYNPLKYFSAQMLPITGVDDKGRVNPFPLMRVVAKAKDNGAKLAAADAVVTMSADLSCTSCHAKGKKSADDTVWYTPVTTSDPEAKGEGYYPPGTSNHQSVWAPAVQNRFELKVISGTPATGGGGGHSHGLVATAAATTDTAVYDMVNPFNPASPQYLRTDEQAERFQPMAVMDTAGNPVISQYTGQAMYLRGDRIKAYRVVDDGAYSGVGDHVGDKKVKVQVQLKFFDPENDSKQAAEKAAMLNVAVMHDYYDSFGPTNPAAGAARGFSTIFADQVLDNNQTPAQPAGCGGHHFPREIADAGLSANYDARFVYSGYSRTMHGFHGRFQVYKQDVTVDGVTHKKGELIRDSLGIPKMVGGAGWDPENKDGFKTDVPGQYDGGRNDIDFAAFPMDPNGELLLPFEKDGPKTALQDNCAQCHAGRHDTIMRDAHFTAGMKCEDCHGDMQAVGGLHLRPGKEIDDKHAFRQFVYDQPDCGSCHTGSGQEEIKRVAFDLNDKSATPFPIPPNSEDQRFAVIASTEEFTNLAGQAQKVCFGTDGCNDTALDANGRLAQLSADPLYRKSVDTHGNVPCGACHGGSHGVWPIGNTNANDNVTAKQLQGYDGTIYECDVCHSKNPDGSNSFADGELAYTTPVAWGDRTGTRVKATAAEAYLAGPHGMHPVNDPNWYNKTANDPTPGGWHAVMAKKSGPDGQGDQCSACHNPDRKAANRLAKTQVDRVYGGPGDTMTVSGRKKVVKVAAGETVGCIACHSQKISFRDTPWEATKRVE